MTRWLLPLAAVVLLIVAAAADDPPKQFDVPYRLTDTKHVLVRAKLNGHGPFNFILDTGAPAVFIPNKLARQIGLKLDKKGWGTFDKFEVEGGITVDQARTRVEDLFQLEGMNGIGIAGVELHGVIGYNVLAKFRITYDFAADKLAWVPLDFDPPDPKGIGRGGQGGLELLGPIMKIFAALMGIKPNFETRPRGFLGFTIEEKDGAVLVQSVLDDSPAAKAGLRAGDRLTAIGIAPRRGRVRMTDVDRARDLDRALAGAKPGDDARIDVRRGEKNESLTITLGRGL